MADRPGVWLDLPTDLDLLCHATDDEGTVLGPVGPSAADLKQSEIGMTLTIRFDIVNKVKPEARIVETTSTIAGNSRSYPQNPIVVLGPDDVMTVHNILDAKFDDADPFHVPEIAGEQMALNYRAILFGTITLARALMTEHHLTMGCDPDCVARYHQSFPDMTEMEWLTAVGHVKGEWPNG